MTSHKMKPVVLFKYLDSNGHIEKSPLHDQVQYTDSIGQRGTSSVHYKRKCCKDVVVSFPTEHEKQ